MNINEETANGMCGTSNPSSLCKMSIQEKTEQEDDKQGEEKQSNKYNETSSSPDPPPRKKPKLDTPGDSWISRKPSEESPSTESIIAIDGKTKSPSPLEPSSKHYEPTEKDVVFGKGRFIQNLAGNVRLRKLIKSHFDQYEKADCPQDKTLMAMRLVADIKESGGRFLKEDASAPGLYIEVDSIAAREKIAATFHSHRRRSKLVVNIGTTTSEPKHVAFAARNTTSRQSAPLMMSAKAKDRIRPMIHGSTTVKDDLGLVGRQGRVLGYPPLYASNLLQQELNQLPRRRAFHFSDELARISSMNTPTKLVPSFHKGSLIPGFDQADVEKYANEVLRDKMSRKQMETLKLGSPLFPIVLDDKPEAAVCRSSWLNSGSCAVSAGSDFAKNSQALFASSPLSAVKNSRLSMLSSQRMSSWPLGNSLRRFSPTTTAPVAKDASTAFASSCSEPSKELMHYHATQEDLQAQLYREMGLPGF